MNPVMTRSKQIARALFCLAALCFIPAACSNVDSPSRGGNGVDSNSLTHVTITPVSGVAATRSIVVAGTIHGQFDTRLGAPYSFAIILDGVPETQPSAPYGFTLDAPTIFARQTDGSLEYSTMVRGLIASGTHTVVVRVTDSIGVADSAIVHISTSIPSAKYAASLLVPLMGDTLATAAAINGSGTVLGASYGAGGRGRLVTWQSGGAPSTVAQSDTNSIVAASINDRGDVLATIYSIGGSFPCRKAFIKPAGGSPVIVDPASPCQTTAIDINNSGSVLLGGVNGNSGPYESGVYTEQLRTQLTAINDLGAYVGRHVNLNGGADPAYFRFPGIDAPSAGSDVTPVSGVVSSVVSKPPQADGGVVAINNHNHAIEYVTPPLAAQTSWHLIDANAKKTSLRPALGGYNTGFQVLSLNDQDVVLAWDADVSTGFLSTNGNVMRIQVVTPGVTLVGVVSINNANLILARARVDGRPGVVAVLLMPTT
jgi:hypothetical protein